MASGNADAASTDEVGGSLDAKLLAIEARRHDTNSFD
jgi:hypothetical protein